MSNSWNPWHGCTKLSPGCTHCYVYRQDAMYNNEIRSSEVRKNADFTLPLKYKRDKSYKLDSGSTIYTCMTSDFFVDKADKWRAEAWDMIRQRSDTHFFIFTKRIDRFRVELPADWGDGYEHVIIGCTIENQAMADYRLPIFNALPIKHKVIIVAPMLEKMNIAPYLNSSIEEVAASGESGADARVLHYEWVLDLRRQCIENDIPFCFHQTGAKLLKDGKLYRIKRKFQLSQARKANIDYKSKGRRVEQ